jgi:hypothetical protein
MAQARGGGLLPSSSLSFALWMFLRTHCPLLVLGLCGGTQRTDIGFSQTSFPPLLHGNHTGRGTSRSKQNQQKFPDPSTFYQGVRGPFPSLCRVNSLLILWRGASSILNKKPPLLLFHRAVAVARKKTAPSEGCFCDRSLEHCSKNGKLHLALPKETNTCS